MECRRTGGPVPKGCLQCGAITVAGACYRMLQQCPRGEASWEISDSGVLARGKDQDKARGNGTANENVLF